MSQLINSVTHPGAVGLAIFVGSVVLLLIVGMLFIQSRRIALLSARLDALTQGEEGESLEGVLDAHMESVVRVTRELDEMQARTAVLEGNARLHFARLGLVRFNPFEDTGSNQSFALAMLDANNDGFVITSLHSRAGTRIYAKAVFGGEAEATLGEEEAKAIEIAVSQGGAPTTSGAPAPAPGRRGGSRGSKSKAAAAPVLPREAVVPKEAAVAEGAAVPKEAVAPRAARQGKAAASAARVAPEPEADPVPADEGQTSPLA